jgi:hypothetical protein
VPRYSGDLSSDEREQLYYVIEELTSRGIPVPTDYYKKVVKWSVDSRGYFSKLDGRFFNPNENHVNFLKSTARFCALISGRGGGKSAAGSQKALQKIRGGASGAVLNPDF